MKAIENNDKFYRDKDWLYQQLVVEGKTQGQVARESRYHNSTISEWAGRYGLRPEKEHEEPRYHSKDFLYQELIIKEKTQKQLAKELGCTISAINKWTRKHGMRFATKRYNPPYKDKDVLFDRLCNHNMSYQEISQEMCCAPSTIRTWAVKFGIEKTREIKTILDYPKLVKEWDCTKNIGLEPKDVTYGSKKFIWWSCVKGHSWKMSPNTRISNKQDCPYCSNQRVCEDNCLESLFPDVAQEWDCQKNDKTPSEVTGGSRYVAWWVCNKDGRHKWKTKVADRKHYGCPFCSNQKFTEDDNLAALYPHLVKEWDHTRNFTTPNEYSKGSNFKAWWICGVCKKPWKQTIKNRALNGTGCPNCNNFNRTSIPEQTLFFYISKVFPNAFNGSKIDKMEADILIESEKVIIEYDGVYWHSNKLEKDTAKSDKFRSKGYKIIRVREEGLDPVHNVVNIFVNGQKIDYNTLIEETFDELSQLIGSKVTKPEVNLESDKILIDQLVSASKREKSLAYRYPELLNNWDYKNNKISPWFVRPFSVKEAYWVCDNGHQRKEKISDITIGKRCRQCMEKGLK